jgi:thiamine biosynthesis protein ThiI
MERIIILHHHEIVLKGDNRGYFEGQLRKNIRQVLAGLMPRIVISGGYGKFIINLKEKDPIDEILSRLNYVFGLANICIGIKVEQNLKAFFDAAERLLDGIDFNTIRIHTKRPDKSFPLKSMDVNKEVGAYICSRFKKGVDLSNPDQTIHIDIVDGAALVYRMKIPGAGGLPLGTAGKVVALLSSGFDSPVASWKIMKRGATAIFIHFHSMPFTSQASLDQVRKIVRLLTRYQLFSKLYVVPFAELQKEIVLRSPQSLRIILYRRMMLRIAEAVAHSEKAEALVTGEAVGQVASQTLRNIRNINSATSFPVLRPLSGTDKEETMEIARGLGTYEISKEPYDDCCSFLAPRRPETWSDYHQIAAAESNLNIPLLVEATMTKMEIERYTFP